MALNENVAIIGATGSLGVLVATRLSKAGYPLLLMDKERENLLQLQQHINQIGRSSDITILQCSREASWEAGIILITKEKVAATEIAGKIQEVANSKVVLYLTTNEAIDYGTVQVLLPYSKIVTVKLDRKGFSETVDAVVTGSHDVALQTAGSLMDAAGFSTSIHKFTR